MTERAFEVLTIGIPTFNRGKSLQGAVESALAQTYATTQIVICDNASTDGTEEYCNRIAAKNSNVLYIRHARNIGPIENFLSCLRNSESEYFMWLADDDWLDPEYAQCCIDELRANADFVLVAGKTTYYSAEGIETAGGETTLAGQSRARRLFRYYGGALDGNEIFYGVYRRKVLDGVVFPKRIGGDWHLVASVVFQGKVKTIHCTRIHRRSGGTSSGIGRMIEILELPGYRAVFPYLWVVVDEVMDIARGRSPFDCVKGGERAALALGVLVSAFCWHIVRNGTARTGAALAMSLLGERRYRVWREKLRSISHR